MDPDRISPITRCVQCIACANALGEPGAASGCAAGATPPAWTERCDFFVDAGSPVRFHERRRSRRREADRGEDGRHPGDRTH